MSQMKAKDQLEAVLSRLTNEQGECVNDYRRGLINAIEYALGRKELNLEPVTPPIPEWPKRIVLKESEDGSKPLN
jgi:hypothetical protein